MKSILRVFPIVAVGLLAGALVPPSPAQAQGSSRAGTWEFLLPVTYSPSTDFTGQGGSGADLNSDMGMGLGFGYNLNNHLQLGGTITWSSRGYNATSVNTDGTTKRSSGTLDSSTLALNATYYFTAVWVYAIRDWWDRQHVHRLQHSHRNVRDFSAGMTRGTGTSATPIPRRKRPLATRVGSGFGFR